MNARRNLAAVGLVVVIAPVLASKWLPHDKDQLKLRTTLQQCYDSEDSGLSARNLERGFEFEDRNYVEIDGQEVWTLAQIRDSYSSSTTQMTQKTEIQDIRYDDSRDRLIVRIQERGTTVWEDGHSKTFEARYDDAWHRVDGQWQRLLSRLVDRTMGAVSPCGGYT